MDSDVLQDRRSSAEGEIVFWLGTCVDIHEAILEAEASKARERACKSLSTRLRFQSGLPIRSEILPTLMRR